LSDLKRTISDDDEVERRRRRASVSAIDRFYAPHSL